MTVLQHLDRTLDKQELDIWPVSRLNEFIDLLEARAETFWNDHDIRQRDKANLLRSHRALQHAWYRSMPATLEEARMQDLFANSRDDEATKMVREHLPSLLSLDPPSWCVGYTLARPRSREEWARLAPRIIDTTDLFFPTSPGVNIRIEDTPGRPILACTAYRGTGIRVEEHLNPRPAFIHQLDQEAQRSTSIAFRPRTV